MLRWLGPKFALLAFALVIGALNLSLSLRSGMLSMPSVYDDCSYLFDGFQRLYFGAFNSVLQLTISFLKNPPHAPSSTLISMLGFAIFGPYRVGPYILNIGLLIAYAFVVYRLARTSLDAWASAFLGAFMLYAPASHALVTDMFPDMASALVFGLSLYLLLREEEEVAATPKLLAVGAVAASAILVKPSGIVVVLPMSVVAGLIGAYRPYQTKPLERAIGHRRASFMGIGALFVLVPFTLIWGPSIGSYVYYVLFSHSELWATQGTRLFHAFYYSVGPGGKLGLADFFYIGLLFILIDVIRSRKTLRDAPNYRIMALYVVTALTYAGMIVSAEKDIHQGCFFYFPFLLCSTLAISRTTSGLDGPSLKNVVPVLLVVLALMFFKPATVYDFQIVTPFHNEQATKEQAAIVEAVAQDLTDPNKATCGMAELGFIGGQYLSATGLALQVALDHHFLVEPADFGDATTVDELRQRTKAVRFLVFPEPGLAIQWITALRPAPQFLSEMVADPAWRRVDILGRDMFIRLGC